MKVGTASQKSLIEKRKLTLTWIVYKYTEMFVVWPLLKMLIKATTTRLPGYENMPRYDLHEKTTLFFVSIKEFLNTERSCSNDLMNMMS